MTRLLKSAGDLVRPGQANKTPGATPLYLVWDFIVCRTLRSSESSLNLGTTCASVGLGVGAGNTDVTEMASGLTLITSSSRVMHLPPAAVTRARADSVNLRAAILRPAGMSRTLIVSHGTDNNGGPVV